MRQSRPRPSSRVSRTWEEVPTLSSQVYLYSRFLTDKGCAPARAAVDCPITTSGAAPLIVDGFRRVRRSTFTEGAIMERAEYHRHSRARMAETAKDASRPPAPDAPERIDHRRRCTRHDHWTCCRGSRGSASLPCHTLRKRVENVPRRFAPTAHFERNDVTIICETVHQGFFAEMQSIRPHSGSIQE